MESYSFPSAISRRLHKVSNVPGNEKSASKRREELAQQVEEFLAHGNSVTEITQNIKASVQPIKPGPDNMEMPRPRQGQGAHREPDCSESAFVNSRETAKILKIHPATLTSYRERGLIKLASTNTKSGEKLYLRKEVLELKAILENKGAKP